MRRKSNRTPFRRYSPLIGLPGLADTEAVRPSTPLVAVTGRPACGHGDNGRGGATLWARIAPQAVASRRSSVEWCR